MKRMKHSKKSLAIVLMLTLMGIGTVPKNIQTVYADSRGTVRVSALNLRSEASKESGIIGVLGRGSQLTISETAGDWYKVTATADGVQKTGYVFSTYVDVHESGEISGDTTSTNGIVNVNGLHIRKTPSLSGAIIGAVNSGTRVTILDEAGDWYKTGLTVGGRYITGYMYKSYVTKSTSAPETNQEMVEVSGTGIVNTPVLNARKGPSVSSTRLGCIYGGATVTIKGKIGDWYKILAKVNGKEIECYASAQYITMKSDSDANTNQGTNDDKHEETVLTGRVRVDVSALNLRSEASATSRVLTCLRKDNVLTLLGKNGDWYKVSVESNGAKVTGYVFAQYVALVADNGNGGSQQPSDSEKPAEKKYGVVNTSVLNLRERATTSSKVIGALYKNSTVTVQSVTSDGKWYKVDALVNGRATTGYVFSRYVDLTDQAPESNQQGEGDADANGSYTAEEVKLLSAIVYCEAGNQIYEGKLAVANVVLNRVNSPRFPNTMKEVIYQRGQFAPACSGSLAAALRKGVPEECVKAAKDAIAGNNNVEGYYFFNTYVDVSKVAGYIKIDDHIFYHY